jgi:formate--tetrahydrofolate ligase
MALGYADYVVTEAGFASDLGAEKFLDIKCRIADLWPRAVVVVATCRALKLHGGVAPKSVNQPDPAAVERGLPNLEKHIENMQAFGFQPVVAINLFHTDVEEEIAVVEAFCQGRGLRVARSDAYSQGGAGAEDLARHIVEVVKHGPTKPRFLYPLELSPEEKIAAIATRLYGAKGVAFDGKARADLERARRMGVSNLPVCIAKTQNSLSDDPTRVGRPEGFDLTVREVRLSTGAGFLVAIAGNILTMPGLPKVPAALSIDVDQQGRPVGLF